MPQLERIAPTAGTTAELLQEVGYAFPKATILQFDDPLHREQFHVGLRTALATDDALCNLGTVAGNHGQFVFAFSPDAVVVRITTDPAPRLLY